MWLRAHDAHKQEGLFRTTGSDTRILQLQNVLDGELNQFQFPDDEDPHVIATLLKRFFKAMAEPLFTFKFYTTFIAVALVQTEQEKKLAIKKALTLLPKHNINLLKFVMQYLHELAAQHSNTTLMDAYNLASVFGPTLIRPEIETPFLLISDIPSITSLLVTLIENYEIFLKHSTHTPTTAKESEDKIQEFEKDMRKLYTIYSISTLKAFKTVKSASGNDSEKWKRKMSLLSVKLKDGDVKLIRELSKRILHIEYLQHQKSPPTSPQASPRKLQKSTHERSVSLNHALVNILAKLTSELDDKLQEEELEIEKQTPHKELRVTYEVETEKKLSKHDELISISFSETSKKETDSEADTSERSFVVMVPTYNEEELNAQESGSDEQDSSASDSEHQHIKKVLKQIYGDDNDEEKSEVKKMLKVVVLGEEEQ